MKQIFLKNSGFTLIEVLVAVSLFMVCVTVICQVFVIISQSQRVIKAQQRLQSDTRIILSHILEQVRLGSIDYQADVYSEQLTNPSPVLVIRDINDQVVIYRQSSDIYTDTVCPDARSTPCLEVSVDNGLSWDSITSHGVKLNDLRFYIMPDQDPFRIAQGDDYQSNQQPNVTIAGQLMASNLTNLKKNTLDFQTSVSTRLYQR